MTTQPMQTAASLVTRDAVEVDVLRQIEANSLPSAEETDRALSLLRAVSPFGVAAEFGEYVLREMGSEVAQIPAWDHDSPPVEILVRRSEIDKAALVLLRMSWDLSIPEADIAEAFDVARRLFNEHRGALLTRLADGLLALAAVTPEVPRAGEAGLDGSPMPDGTLCDRRRLFLDDMVAVRRTLLVQNAIARDVECQSVEEWARLEPMSREERMADMASRLERTWSHLADVYCARFLTLGVPGDAALAA